MHEFRLRLQPAQQQHPSAAKAMLHVLLPEPENGNSRHDYPFPSPAGGRARWCTMLRGGSRWIFHPWCPAALPCALIGGLGHKQTKPNSHDSCCSARSKPQKHQNADLNGLPWITVLHNCNCTHNRDVLPFLQGEKKLIPFVYT